MKERIYINVDYFKKIQENPDWVVCKLPISQLVIKSIAEKNIKISELSSNLGYENEHDALKHLKNLLGKGVCVKRLESNLPRLLGISPEEFAQAKLDTAKIVSKPVLSIPKNRQSDEESLFLENFELILAKKTTILDTPEFYFIHPLQARCMICAAFFHFGGDLCLGHLLSLWDQGHFRLPCPICSKDTFVFEFIKGLSVVFSVTAICLHCHKYVLPKRVSIEWKTALDLRTARSNTVISTEIIETQEFHWGGIRPGTRAREVRKQIIVPVGLQTLINELRSGKK